MKVRKYFITIAVALFAATNMSFAADTTKPNAVTEQPTFEMMTSRMTDMQKEMDQINKTKDPKEKQALMEKHMDNMQTEMKMMGQMMNGGMGQGKNHQPMMMNQMGQMHGMMNQMMGQMQGHMRSCPFNQSTK